MGALALQRVENFFDAVSHDKNTNKCADRLRVNLPLYRDRTGWQKRASFYGPSVTGDEIDDEQEHAPKKGLPLDAESS
jgi:hypothetical protein